MLTKDKSCSVLHNEILVFTYLVFFTLYINIRMKHVLCVSNILQLYKRYIKGMEFLSGVYNLPVPDLFGERSMILDPICSLLIFDWHVISFLQVYMYGHKQEHFFILHFSFYLRVQCVLNDVVFELVIIMLKNIKSRIKNKKLECLFHTEDVYWDTLVHVKQKAKSKNSNKKYLKNPKTKQKQNNKNPLL